MTWIPALRRMAKNYDTRIVVCPVGHGYLYRDFATRIEEVRVVGKADRWLCNGKCPTMPKRFKKKYKGSTIVTPNEHLCMNAKRKYIRYGTGQYESLVLIHARALTRYNSTNRNWPKKKYAAMLKELGTPLAASIGTNAHHIKGTADLRNIEIEDLCNFMSSAKLVVGPSSGPMHLAALCGAPAVVWTDDSWQKSINGTNKDMYKTKWNPFKTKVKVIEGKTWNAKTKDVVEAAKKVMR